MGGLGLCSRPFGGGGGAGEIALLEHEPRRATVTAGTAESLLCLRLGRDKFERLLGPCADLLRRHMGDYHPYGNAAA